MLGHCGLTVCPPNINAMPAIARRCDNVSTDEGFYLRVAQELLREVARCRVELDYPDLSCVTVQIRRETWKRVRAYLPSEETKP